MGRKSRNSSSNYDEPINDKTCNAKCLKGLLIAFNFLFILSGLGALAVGVWTIMSKMEYAALLSSAMYTITVYLLIGAGVVVLVTGIVGCIGAIQKKSKTLLVYVILLIIIFVVECIAGILAFVYHETLHTELSNDLKTHINKNYNTTGYESLSQAVDSMQQDFKCCGVDTHTDWTESRFIVNNVGLKTPESCCKTPSARCSERDHPSNIYSILKNEPMGCLVKLENYLKDHLFILALAGLIVAGIELLVIIFGCCLMRAVKEEEKDIY